MTYILAIETSCDDTGAAVYDTTDGLLAHRLHSQIAVHADYGGVVPELAARALQRAAIGTEHRVLTGEHGEEACTAAWELLAEGLVAIVASDAPRRLHPRQEPLPRFPSAAPRRRLLPRSSARSSGAALPVLAP